MKLNIKHSNKLASILLRVGLAGVLLYASISSLKSPLAWVGYLPQFLVAHVSATLLIHVFAVYEFVLAVWLLVGLYLPIAGLVAAATFAGIFLSNLAEVTITFRDIAMIFAALALVFLDSGK